jgi:hypothetical protein
MKNRFFSGYVLIKRFFLKQVLVTRYEKQKIYLLSHCNHEARLLEETFSLLCANFPSAFYLPVRVLSSNGSPSQ